VVDPKTRKAVERALRAGERSCDIARRLSLSKSVVYRERARHGLTRHRDRTGWLAKVLSSTSNVLGFR
jgi:transposase-like protein